jgi:hypothetical protein
LPDEAQKQPVDQVDKPGPNILPVNLARVVRQDSVVTRMEFPSLLSFQASQCLVVVTAAHHL